MTKTWLMRRAVRRPVFERSPRASARRCAGCPSSGARPWTRGSARRPLPRPPRCAARRRSRSGRSRGRAARATAAILAAGPTRIGTMMPASAASTGPRSEVSSQGWTTTVVAGGTSLAWAMSRSYLAARRRRERADRRDRSDVVLVSRHDRSSACAVHAYRRRCARKPWPGDPPWSGEREFATPPSPTPNRRPICAQPRPVLVGERAASRSGPA